MDLHRVVTKLNHPACVFPAEGDRGDTLLSCFSCRALNKRPLHGLFIDTLFPFLCFSLVVSLFKTVPKLSAEVLSSVLKYKKEKIDVLDKLYSAMDNSAVSCEFSVNKPTIYIT